MGNLQSNSRLVLRSTTFGLTSDNVRSTSHEVKSACQPKGWRTSFGLTSAKLQQFSQMSQLTTEKYMLDSKNLHSMPVTY